MNALEQQAELADLKKQLDATTTPGSEKDVGEEGAGRGPCRGIRRMAVFRISAPPSHGMTCMQAL